MSYQLLAIKVLTGCSSNIRKCLNEDTLYFLSSSYKKDPNCNENLLKEKRKYYFFFCSNYCFLSINNILFVICKISAL